MASVTISLEDEEFERLNKQTWVNWSEIARKAVIKKEMLERYLITGKITDEDNRFCEENDWHPVDELPFQPEAVKRLKSLEKRGKSHKYRDMSELRAQLKHA